MLQRTVVSDLQKQSDNWLELEGRVVHPMVFTKKEDVLAAGLQQGQLVDPTRHCQNEERLARRFMVAPFEIARGCTATYFPEPNVLVPIDSTADRSNTP